LAADQANQVRLKPATTKLNEVPAEAGPLP